MSLGKTELVIQEKLVISRDLSNRLNTIFQLNIQEIINSFTGEETETSTSTTEEETTICQDNC